MDNKWAADNLQTIRTLMERSSLYRRAMAPIMLFSGSLGLLAAIAGITFKLESPREFLVLWLSIATICVLGSYLLARRQSIKEHEPFWSPPTRRVTQALLPPLLAGFVIGLAILGSSGVEDDFAELAAVIWVMFYGCALHAAGFFTPRGIRLFAWMLIGGACVLLGVLAASDAEINVRTAHLTMGFFFGLLHLAFGIYLYFTEKKSDAP